MNEFNPDWDQMAVLVEHSQEQAAKIEQLEKKLAEILQDAQPEPHAEQARRVEQETQGRMRINPVTGDVSIGSPPYTTTPPAAQREWAGLEAEDLAQIESDDFWSTGNHMAIALAVEAKLKEKNHD